MKRGMPFHYTTWPLTYPLKVILKQEVRRLLKECQMENYVICEKDLKLHCTIAWHAMEASAVLNNTFMLRLSNARNASCMRWALMFVLPDFFCTPVQTPRTAAHSARRSRRRCCGLPNRMFSSDSQLMASYYVKSCERHFLPLRRMKAVGHNTVQAPEEVLTRQASLMLTIVLFKATAPAIPIPKVSSVSLTSSVERIKEGVKLKSVLFTRLSYAAWINEEEIALNFNIITRIYSFCIVEHLRTPPVVSSDKQQLHCGKVLQRIFELRAVIEIFLNEKHSPLTELQINAWLWKLAFYVDLTKHVNELNLRLQGENQHLPDLYTNIKSFRKKLILFQSQLRSECFFHFKTCEIFSHTTETEFPIDFAIETLSALKLNFDASFSDSVAIANQIKIFQNPFAILTLKP
nr:unnamed protein product [Callosobruchus analis]